jgi:hypothetical protein
MGIRKAEGYRLQAKDFRKQTKGNRQQGNKATGTASTKASPAVACGLKPIVCSLSR